MKNLATNIILAISYVLLMYGFEVGRLFHELYGILIILVLFYHLWINWASIKVYVSKISKNKLTLPKWGVVALDILSLVSFLVALVSGIFISSVLFDFGYTKWIYILHDYSSWVCLGILLFHLLQHWRRFIQPVKKIIKKFTYLKIKENYENIQTQK